ncbi:MAG: flippase activity-associated protein Agl23 [Dehalococcoidia bacterium]
MQGETSAALADEAEAPQSTEVQPPRTGQGELIAWAAIMAAALITRLWDVGGRVMHYDEILHVWYSWRFAEGLGYTHNPLTHGPFLYHANALLYLIFGASDVTSRLLPALFGVALVGMPFLLRRELGRYGAIAAAVLMLASPSLLYFSRFIRNDVYMAVFAVGLMVVMVRYWERPQPKLLIIWAALWALAFSAKETAFLLAGTFGLFLLVLSARHFWDWARGRAKLSALPPSGVLFLVLATITAPLWAPLSGLFQDVFGIIMVNPDGSDPRVIAGELFRADAPSGSPAGGAMYVAAVLVLAMSAVAVTLGLLWDRRRWPLLMAVFVVIWLPLHTSMFTHWDGFFTGLWGSLGYWMAQQGVERASQPSYYYLVTMLTYEFLILIPAVLGAAYIAARGKLFDIFLVYFAFMNFLLFSYAGERMPWLTMGITFPAALIAGKAVGLLIEGAGKSHLAPAAFAAGLGLMFMVPFAVFRVVSAPSPFGDAGLWFAVLGTMLVLLASAAMASRLMLSPAAVMASLSPMRRPHVLPSLAAMGLGALGVLLALTTVTSVRAAYSYAQYERPTELLVYSQTGQETSYIAQCVERIAAESGRSREDLRFLIGERDNFAWQWRWYLRDYPSVTYRSFDTSPLSTPPDADIVLISSVDESSVRPQLDGFSRVGTLSHLWWFSNGAYGGLTVGKIWDGVTNSESLRATMDYFFTRTWNGSPMYRSTGYMYVSDELESLAEGCVALRAAEDS